MKNPVISVITVVFNNKGTISSAIDSVLGQTYSNIEHIIVDGGSTDGTVEIIQGYGKKIDKFISGHDKGIYDAMNKGIDLATGDIVGILNSDDIYYDRQVLSDVVSAFESNNADAVYGDLVYVDKNDTNKVVRYWKSNQYKPGEFLKGWHPPHPTFFVKKEIYKKYGMFDCSLDISADFELMLRFIEKYKIKTSYLPKVLAKMRLGGESNKSLRNIFQANINCIKAFKKNGFKVGVFYPFVRLIPKAGQFFVRSRSRNP
ncbi:MAG: glycosyltransferase family 2 protein [Candidatus Margulisiibacteriota bacterium]